MKTIGIVLGRFQPLHYGHIHLIKIAIQENEELVVCIGSAQKSAPLPINERHRRVNCQLQTLTVQNYRIIDFVDPEPLSDWPAMMASACRITDTTKNTLYRADNDLTEAHLSELARIGITVSIIPRIRFPYKDPTGIYHEISSATDIKHIHKKLGLEHLL